MNKDVFVDKLSSLIIYSIFIFSLGVFTSKFLIYLGMGLSLIFWLVKIGILRSSYSFKKNDYLIPILMFVSSILISGIGSWNNEILENKFFYSFIFFFIVINEIKNKKEFLNIINILLFSALISAFYGLYQHHFLNMRRINSFSFPLSFGNFMAVLILFTIVYILWSDFSNKQKIFLGIINIIFVLNLIFTQARGAWLGLVVSLIFLGLLKGKKVLITIIILLLIVFILLPTNYTNRFMSSFDIEYNLKTNRSNATRIALWNVSFKMFKDNFINGVGYDNFKESYLNKYQVDGVRGFDHTHNNILNFAAELGIIGLISFLFLMYFILKKLINYYRQNQILNLKLFHLSSISAFIAYHVQGLTQYNFGDTETLHFFWFLIALNFVIYNNFSGVELNEN